MREGSAQELNGAAGDHRRRLIAAMVEAASEYGYLNATVSRVVALAGVSRATFYRHFTSRDDCFQAAYRANARSVREAVRATARDSPSGERPAAIVDRLLGGLAADPAMARMMLVEALAAPPPIRSGHEDLMAHLEREIAAFLDVQPPTGAVQIPATALLEGVGQVLASRALAGSGELLRLRGDLGRWIDAYRLPEGAPPLAQREWTELARFSKVIRGHGRHEPALLPRGRSALSREEAASRRRRRILDVTVHRVATDGYSALTVAGIAATARVPRNAFYSHFSGKDDALRAAQTANMQAAMGAAAAEYSPPAPWPRRVWSSLTAFLTHVAENPDQARLDFVESYAAGRTAIRHRHQNRMVFALFLEEGYRQNERAAELPRFCSEAIAAALFGMMRKLVVEARTEELLTLLPSAAYTILAPFLGPREAASQVRAWAPAAR